jgi:hypothetical protein
MDKHSSLFCLTFGDEEKKFFQNCPQKKFLLFTTGSDRVPVGGMGEMTFKITRINNKGPML